MQYPDGYSLLTEVWVLGATRTSHTPMLPIKHGALFLKYCANKLRYVPPQSISVFNNAECKKCKQYVGSGK